MAFLAFLWCALRVASSTHGDREFLVDVSDSRRRRMKELGSRLATFTTFVFYEDYV
ncbi:MAG TPA: hypothetical protein VJ742_12540 [Nitrososphaera sp.]|nr:hypothetical protein [Nitrososphaera sp.]